MAEMARLEPLTVIAMPLAEDAGYGFQAVTVIDREQIEQAPAASLADILALAPGVDVRRRGGSRIQADIGIRGSGYEQSLILVDGVGLRNPQTGHHHLNLPVPLEHIERIEILRGPGLTGFGSRNTGGAINIVTRSPEASEAGAGLRVGDYGFRGMDAHGGLRGDASTHLVSAEREVADGFMADEPTDFDLRRAHYTGNLVTGNGQIRWGLGIDEREFGAWKFYTADFPDQREETRSRLGYVTGAFELGRWKVRPRASVSGHEDEFSTRVGEALFVNEHETVSQALGVSATTESDRGATELGLDGERVRIESSALGDHRRDEAGIWLAHRRQVSERVQIAGGISRVHDREFGNSWLPHGALHFQLDRNLETFVAAGRSSRPPSYTELYLQSAGNVGNPDVGPERALQREAGFRWDGGSQQVAGTVFQRRIGDAIDWGRLPGEVTWQADSFDNQRTRGAELEWSWRPVEKGPLRRLGVSWTGLNASIDDRGLEIKYAPDYPRHSLVASGRFALFAGLKLDFNARHVNRSSGEQATLLGGRVSRKFGPVQVLVEGSNLLDETLVEAGFAPLPGRWLFAGLRWSTG